MSSKRVKVSARTIHALLAGQLSLERYLESHKDSARVLEIALKSKGAQSARCIQKHRKLKTTTG
jgi:hypothetical protein